LEIAQHWSTVRCHGGIARAVPAHVGETGSLSTAIISLSGTWTVLTTYLNLNPEVYNTMY